MCVLRCLRNTSESLLLITFLQFVISIDAAKEPKIMFEVNGFYLDDMLTYSPTSFDNFSNSISDNFSMIAAEANRPQELQCPSMNVISTRYRCKVSWLYGHKAKELKFNYLSQYKQNFCAFISHFYSTAIPGWRALDWLFKIFLLPRLYICSRQVYSKGRWSVHDELMWAKMFSVFW